MIFSGYLYSTLAIALVSGISLIGAITIIFSGKQKSFLKFMIAFAVGGLLGDVFIHILPEITEQGKLTQSTLFLILASILTFFMLERFLHWHHCYSESDSYASDHKHNSKNREHNHLAILNLVGDGAHNIIDGLIITSSFLVNPHLGIATTIAVILHEIPQELGDFSILIHSGMSTKKALFYNVLSGVTSFLGMFIILLFKNIDIITYIALPITAGGFLYIAIADLIPELHKHNTTRDVFLQILGLLGGLGVMVLLGMIE